MAARVAGLFFDFMKTPAKTHQARNPKTGKRDRRVPSEQSRDWKAVLPPRFGERDAAREWSPGASGRRGYEKAVEDWWWL
jgi:hypothetical protein